ncbi:MAG: alpha/beta fold hydrolase [Pseudomonadota bacterium]
MIRKTALLLTLGLLLPAASETEIRFPSDADGITLEGTLLHPGAGPAPVVIMVSGSGPQDRDETIGGRKPFRVIAEDLVKRGVASFRFDDRGIGGSGGTQDTTLEEVDADLSGALRAVCGRAEVDPTQIGFLGHSAGAINVARLLGRNAGAAFGVMLAGPAVHGEALLREQIRLRLQLLGKTEAEQMRNDETVGALIAAARRGPDLLKATAEGLALQDNADPDWSARQIEFFGSKMSRSFVESDPATDLSKVTAPMLALYGMSDWQVEPHINTKAAREAMINSPEAKVLMLEWHDHLLQFVPNMDPMVALGPAPSPQAMEILGDWIEDRKPSTRSACEGLPE